MFFKCLVGRSTIHTGDCMKDIVIRRTVSRRHSHFLCHKIEAGKREGDRHDLKVMTESLSLPIGYLVLMISSVKHIHFHHREGFGTDITRIIIKSQARTI